MKVGCFGLARQMPAAILCGAVAIVGCKGTKAATVSSSASSSSSSMTTDDMSQSCSWASIAFKQAAYDDMKRDWDAVSSGRWGEGARPTNRMTFGIADNAHLDELAEVLRGAHVHSVNPASNAYEAAFASPDDAIKTFRLLACEKGVAWVAMVIGYESPVQEVE